MNILDTIVAAIKTELSLKKQVINEATLEKSVLFDRQPISLKQNFLHSQIGILAEFKRRSPSKGEINFTSEVEKVASDYEKSGVSGISVLTNHPFFGGNLTDLLRVRNKVNLPVLRKEFIVDAYQIIEAKAYGADVILLIAAVLSAKEISTLSRFAHSLGLEVIAEIHSEDELDKVLIDSIDIIGVNNRNLKTFNVSIENSLVLSTKIPGDFLKISESGIADVENIITLRKSGFKGFLIGENFMKTPDPGLACAQFIHTLKEKLDVR